jgi:hypothetical protein
MMRRAWSWLGLNLGKHAGLVSVIGLAVTVVLGIGLTQLKFVTNITSLLNKSDPAYVHEISYEHRFGGTDLLTMISMDHGYTVSDLGEDEAQIKAMTARIDAVPGIRAVISPITALTFSNQLTSAPTGNITNSVAGKILLAAVASATARYKTIRTDAALTTDERLAAVPAADRVITNPAWAHFLIYANPYHGKSTIRPAMRAFFPNVTHGQVLIRFVGGQTISQEGATAAAVMAVVNGTTLPHATTVTTGAPALLMALNNYLRGGMLLLGGIAMVVMLVILVLLFDVRWRLLPLVVVAIGTVWAFGLAGFFHVPLTLATIAGLPIMLGIGIDYAIQLHSRVEEEVILDRVAHPIQATARNLGPALLVVTFDAVFAFLALQFAHVPMIRQFGTLLAIGVAAICACSIFAPLAVLGIREYKSPSQGRKDFSQGFLSRLVVRLGSLPGRAAIPLALVSVVVFLSGLAVEGHLTIQTDPVTWLNPGTSVVKNIHALQAGIGDSNELDVMVTGPDLFTDKSVAYVFGMQTAIHASNASLIKPANGIVTTTAAIATVPGVPPYIPTGTEVRLVYDAAPPDVRKITALPTGTAFNVIFPGRTTSLDQLNGTVKQIESYPQPATGSMVPTGTAAIGVGLLENLESNRILLTYLAVLFVFLFLSARLRSVVRALLSLVPVLVAVGMANLVAYALAIKLSPATAVGGPLVVAACTEFTSLILLRFIEERSRGLTPRQAMEVTSSRTGRAFAVSGLTAIAGIGVVATSSLPVLRGFGLIVGFNVTIALLSALVVLPPVLVWADGRNWVSRGMLRPDPGARPPVLQAEAAGTAPRGQGWYPETAGGAVQRYWNGQAWATRIHWDGTDWVPADEAGPPGGAT